MSNYRVKMAGTSVPNREVELKSSGSGPVISYRLKPEEIENWKREGLNPMLTREKYLQLRLDGMSRTHIQRNYYPSNPPKFYTLLSEWGLKEKDAEERALDLMVPPKKQEAADPVIDPNLQDAQLTELHEKISVLEKEIQDYISELRGERAENDRLLKELDEKQKLIDELSADRGLLLETIDKAVKQHDPVNHPPHYTAGSIECIDAIESATTGLAGGRAYSTGAAIKYLWRWSRKGGAEDLKKARWYIDRLIAELEGEAG